MAKIKNNATTEPVELHANKRARIADTEDGTYENGVTENINSEANLGETEKQHAKKHEARGRSDTSHNHCTNSVAHTTKILIEDEEIEDYDEGLIVCLQKLSEYKNNKANIYALGKLLPTATWGQYKPVNDRSKVLCNPTMGEPLAIWVIGKIAKMWFTKFGVPENQVSMTIMPLSRTLGQQSTLLLAKLSNPAFKQKKQQRIYRNLKPGYLILLEMKMMWYSKKVEDKWQSCAQYEMIAILLLDMAPMPQVDEGRDTKMQSSAN
ncbi:hypothetical protein BDR07DRAFT_1373770 [Suillus spraguei]|nr:hypothetical protein BDR07DRAFT_1373770 [Suillus spraguei]